MNFIAGFLLMVLHDEETAFKALIQLVDRFSMAQLFNSDLPMLKLFFYQLDRLVSIFEPELHSHFKDEMINSSYFASAWFITIFTNCIKNPPRDEETQEIKVNENIMQLWDYFLVSGWKAILKMGLFVLKDGSEELLMRSFEDILHEITEKPKAILCKNPDENEETKEETKEEVVIYQRLRQSFRTQEGKEGSMLGFHLNRLKEEFEESHSAAKLQPKQNKSLSKVFKKSSK